MKVICPNCGYTGNIKEELIPEAGRKIRCPKCNERFVVVKGIQHELDHNTSGVPEIKTPLKQSIISSKKQKNNYNKNLLIALVAVCIVVFVGGFFAYSSFNRFNKLMDDFENSETIEGIDITSDLENSETVEDIDINYANGFDVGDYSITTLRNICISKWDINPDSAVELIKALDAEWDSIINWSEIVVASAEANSFPDLAYFDAEAHTKVIIVAKLLVEKDPERSGLYYAAIAFAYFGFLDFERSQKYGLRACGFENEQGCYIYETSTLLLEEWDGKIWSEDRLWREYME